MSQKNGKYLYSNIQCLWVEHYSHSFYFHIGDDGKLISVTTDDEPKHDWEGFIRNYPYTEPHEKEEAIEKVKAAIKDFIDGVPCKEIELRHNWYTEYAYRDLADGTGCDDRFGNPVYRSRKK